jgi:hypothetical protein
MVCVAKFTHAMEDKRRKHDYDKVQRIGKYLQAQ